MTIGLHGTQPITLSQFLPNQFPQPGFVHQSRHRVRFSAALAVPQKVSGVGRIGIGAKTEFPVGFDVGPSGG